MVGRKIRQKSIAPKGKEGPIYNTIVSIKLNLS